MIIVIYSTPGGGVGKTTVAQAMCMAHAVKKGLFGGGRGGRCAIFDADFEKAELSALYCRGENTGWLPAALQEMLGEKYYEEGYAEVFGKLTAREIAPCRGPGFYVFPGFELFHVYNNEVEVAGQRIFAEKLISLVTHAVKAFSRYYAFDVAVVDTPSTLMLTKETVELLSNSFSVLITTPHRIFALKEAGGEAYLRYAKTIVLNMSLGNIKLPFAVNVALPYLTRAQNIAERLARTHGRRLVREIIMRGTAARAW